jgi:hypothetical protein
LKKFGQAAFFSMESQRSFGNASATFSMKTARLLMSLLFT